MSNIGLQLDYSREKKSNAVYRVLSIMSTNGLFVVSLFATKSTKRPNLLN